MALSDLLGNLLSSISSPSPNAQVPTDDNSSTDVSPVTVTAPPRAPPQSAQMVPPILAQALTQAATPTPDPNTVGGVNYSNSDAVQAIQQANAADQPPPGGYGKSAGVYGMLPQSLQHGTLRSVLGSLGDAFLIGSGAQAMYKPNQQRLAVGNAMAGLDPNDPNSVQAAIGRVAGTGAPGAAEMADSTQKNFNELELKKAQMAQLQMYRDQTNATRIQGIFTRQAPAIQGAVAGALTPADYAQRYALADARAKLSDPTTSAADAYGIPEPQDWHPGMTNFGMTTNQQTVSGDKQRGQNITQSDSQGRDAAIVQSAGIGATSRNYATDQHNAQPTEEKFKASYIAAKQAGQPTTSEQDQEFAHDTEVNRRAKTTPIGGGSSSVPIANYGANNPVANGGRPVTPAQARGLPAGTHFLTSDGRWMIR